MRILFLAPQPFYQERGTPIAVRLAMQVLAERSGDQIDMLAYHEGSAIEIPGVRLMRIRMPGFIKNVGPGISIKKLLCDVVFLFTVLKIIIGNKGKPYDLIHAVEESVFIAMLVKLIWSIPYVYDMDSSLALQVTEKWRWARWLYPFLAYFEKLAVRYSTAVVPVCDALLLIAQKHGARDTQLLRDISLLNLDNTKNQGVDDLREFLKLKDGDLFALYIGNLESYQGIDLLIEAFATIYDQVPHCHVVVIGGSTTKIEYYQSKSADLKIAARTHFIGSRPVSQLGDYLLQADILTSPRTIGNNTPMKIYSYLHSGIPILATDLPTHTQVLNSEVALLAPADSHAFGAALLQLYSEPEKRKAIGERARQLAEDCYTFDVFKRDLNALYDRINHLHGQPLTPKSNPETSKAW